MPELPEVETVRRGLEPVMAGRRIVRVEARRPDLRFPLPDRMAERLTGRRVMHLGRRSKYLLATIEGGEVLIMHLGMSGRFTIDGEAHGRFALATGGDARHDHVVVEMAAGNGGGAQAGAHRITYNDPRRFGFMVLVPGAEIEGHPLIRDLGPEPLGNELTPAYLAARAAGRTADLKAFLMDQRTIAGLGNIYVAEALFRAGISPNRAAGCLTDKAGRPTLRAERLVPAIRGVLADAIAAGGSTLRDYRAADGALGYFQHSFLVYGRQGEACVRPGCRGTVQRSIHGGRSTFHCPSCQR
ncbi:MAG: bifunctional DNA-formamidopyrimidine glycosylase/DNA-(apurinic or apyrimidinic site) lyase [Hyphomicrobiaceae bacterium]|nr:bifunctional DNA-formamidopyrimidine glycosylase/DNA-(apurinic or apyrimidinic site) lyase [Hyphomicrobiaceae bacterium]